MCGRVAGRPQESQFMLWRGRSKQAGKVILRRNLERHESEQREAQRADVLPIRRTGVHDHHTFGTQNSMGGQICGDMNRHIV